MRHHLAAYGSLLCLACSPSGREEGAHSGEVVAKFSGGEVTQKQMLVELEKLPPVLRDRYKTPEGAREITQSVVDKQLLVREARKRGLEKNETIARQVKELEERLIVQKLLADEEKTSGGVSEVDARRWYDENKSSLLQAERVRAGRIFIEIPQHASAKERAQANARLAESLRRIRSGTSFEKVASDGSGPERSKGGDLGFAARGDWNDDAFENAAFALTQPGSMTGIVQGRSGIAFFKLIEKRAVRIPSFEEVRTEVEARMAPAQKRRVFDQLVLKLRQSAGVEYVAAEKP